MSNQKLKALYYGGYSWNGPWCHLGPWLFWSPRNLVPEKFGPQEIWFMRGPNILGPKFLGDQKSQWPKWLSGTISVTASLKNFWWFGPKCPFEINWPLAHCQYYHIVFLILIYLLIFLFNQVNSCFFSFSFSIKTLLLVKYPKK